MKEIADMLMDYGVSIVIIILFIWDWVSNKKETKATLNVIKESNENISKTLELLQTTLDNQNHKIDKLLERN